MSGPSTNSGAELADEDVVRAYVQRTDYPAGLFARLLELTAARRRLLDLGCGPGTFARRLAPHFAQRVEDLIDAEHSRATWTRAKMGRRRRNSTRICARWWRLMRGMGW